MTSSGPDKKPAIKTDGHFLGRWSRRKQDALNKQQQGLTITTEALVESEETLPLTDADMPPLESLTENSDYTGFLSPEVSDALRKQALRKLFHCPDFNICDGLDDYDDDYTTFATLGDIVTADMKHQLEMEAQRRLQQAADAGSRQADEETELVSRLPSDDEKVATEQIADNTAIEESLDTDKDTEDKT